MGTHRNPLRIVAAVVTVCLVGLATCKPVPYYLERVYKVHGTVTDAASGEPLESVEVAVGDYAYSELTNGLGDYELEMAEGTWIVNYTRAGYGPHAVEVTLGGSEHWTRVDVALVREGAPQPSLEEVAALLVGLCSAGETAGGLIFEEWAAENLWAFEAADGGVVWLMDANTQIQTHTYIDFAMGTTGYMATGVLEFALGVYPPTLTGELALQGGTITTLGFDLEVAMDMTDPYATTIAGTVTADGWTYDVADMPAFAQAWIDQLVAFMGVYVTAQDAIEIAGTWAGTVDFMGQLYDVVTVYDGGPNRVDSSLYDVGGSTLQPNSARGDYSNTYGRYAPGEPVIGEYFFDVTDFYDGSTWGPPPWGEITGSERWEKEGDTLTTYKDYDQDGTADAVWVLTRQP